MLPQIDTMIGFAAVMLLLSLLITILVQATVALLDLRGKNLRWGVTVILEQALPGLKSPGAVAEKVLAHRTLDLGVHLPVTAIRSDELIRILGHLAEGDEALAAAIRAAHAAVARLDATAPIEAMLNEAFPSEADKVAKVMEAAREAAHKDMGDLKAWYHTVMDRTSERFVRWTRRATVAFAVLLSFGLPIDSMALLKRISTSADVRAHVAESADATRKLADSVGAEVHLASTALAQAKAKHPEPNGVTGEIDRDLDTRAQGVYWIHAHVSPDLQAAFERDYDAEYDARLRPMALNLLGSAASVKARLGETQLLVVPGSWPTPVTRDAVLGMLMSVLFLSLGAPFWFNLLQQLGNMRPGLAGKVDQTEKKAGGRSGG